MQSIAQHVVHEWSFSSAQYYGDPFNKVELDVLFAGPKGTTSRVPAFWAGEGEWRVRFSTPLLGTYRYQTVCSSPRPPLCCLTLVPVLSRPAGQNLSGLA